MPRPTVSLVRLLLPILVGGLAPSIARGQEVEPPSTVFSRLASGKAVEVVLHRPANALTDAVRVGDSVIAATAGGELLRFDGSALRLAKERRDFDGTIVRLGRGEADSVVASLSDGRVCRVDSTTLALTELARLPGKPTWVGWSPAAGDGRGGLVAVVGEVVHDLAANRTIETKNAVSTCLIDREGRLWVGADRGEWAGRVARVDLRSRTVDEVPPPPAPGEDEEPGRKRFWRNIYGFIEMRDSHVWAFGGGMHMGTSAAHVTRVDDLTPRPLYAFEPPAGLEEPDRGRPTMPITHILQQGDRLLVLAYSDVYRVNHDLTDWKRAGELRVRYTWGRPDAVGAYPSVLATLPPARDDEPVLIAHSNRRASRPER